MRILFNLFLLQFFLFSCNEIAEKKITSDKTENNLSKESHDIMFYNVENLFDTVDNPTTFDDDFLPNSKKQWTQKRFHNKLDKISEVITEVSEDGPLFIGLVEIENADVIQALLTKKRLKNIHYNFAHFDSPDERGIDVALVYNEDYFNVLEKEPLVVQLADNDKTRDILYVKGIISGESIPLHIFVNHWPSRREGAEKSEPNRIMAATVLRKKIEVLQRESEDAKILVMGDFNDYPNNNSIINTLDAKRSYSISKNELFNLAARLDEDDKGSYNYRGDWGMLDQMMVSKSMLSKQKGMYSVKKKGLKVFDDEFVLFYDKKYKEYKPSKTYGGNNYYGGYSDHLPIHMKLYRHKK